MMWFARLWCRVVGHRWDRVSEVLPNLPEWDSGTFTIYRYRCSRCGRWDRVTDGEG